MCHKGTHDVWLSLFFFKVKLNHGVRKSASILRSTVNYRYGFGEGKREASYYKCTKHCIFIPSLQMLPCEKDVS